MFRFAFLLFSLSFMQRAEAQNTQGLSIEGDYTRQDSLEVTEAFQIAKEAVNLMAADMERMWNVTVVSGRSKKKLRKEQWENNPQFVAWLGGPHKLRKVRRNIRHMQSRFDHPVSLEVTKENNGRCTGWISAWTLPYGKVRIRLCEDFFIYRTHLQEKILIHEIGHEVGLLFHHRIHGCRAALRAAGSKRNVAKRSPENYAWLAMSYLGLRCTY